MSGIYQQKFIFCVDCGMAAIVSKKVDKDGNTISGKPERCWLCQTIEADRKRKERRDGHR